MSEPPKLCEWCRVQPATKVVIATDVCDSCAGDRALRVRMALARWAKGIRSLRIAKR